MMKRRRDPSRQSSMPRSLENASDPSTAGTTTVGPKHPWKKCEILGQGSFGTVHEAIDRDGMFFAVKEVSMVENDEHAQQAITQLMQEIELLSQFKHKNVVQYFGTEQNLLGRGDPFGDFRNFFLQKHGKLYIFLELVGKGSLASIRKRINLDHSQISAYTRQILKGLKYLHDRNVVHRDIKCANILVDTTGVCKVADFGMAKQMRSMDQIKSSKGSAYWMAPEVIDHEKVSGLPSDIWSLGCSIIEMATGSPPFWDMEWQRVLWAVGHGETPPIPDNLPETGKDFIKLCVDVNPAKRPTATELLNHPFVSLSQPSGEEVSCGRQPITEDRSADFNEGSSFEGDDLFANLSICSRMDLHVRTHEEDLEILNFTCNQSPIDFTLLNNDFLGEPVRERELLRKSFGDCWDNDLQRKFFGDCWDNEPKRKSFGDCWDDEPQEEIIWRWL